MPKNKLLLIPFFAGFILIVYAWYLSFPLLLTSSSDKIFNHISIFYWVGFPLLITSMYLISVTSENTYLKLIMTVGSVIALFSLFYFYYTMSSSDAHYFRGLTENFIERNNPDLQFQWNTYYQWPAFFILADVTCSVSGLELISYEFLLITTIGFLLSTALYVISSKYSKGNEILSVLSFFILSYAYLNYQVAPFTIALCLLFILFALDKNERNARYSIIMIIIYIAITITHALVPLFFVAYLLIRLIISRFRRDFGFFMLSLAIYLLVQITLGEISFYSRLIQIFTIESELSSLVASTFVPAAAQIDIIAQFFSRSVTIFLGLLCLVGFLFMIIKRKLGEKEKAIFLMGIAFSAVGIMLHILGSRAFPFLIFPISVGLLYIYKGRLRTFLKYLILLLLILVVFIPLHREYTGFPVTFQTNEDIQTANFVLEKYDWNSNRLLISDSGMKYFISPQVPGGSNIDTNYQTRFGLQNITNYDCIIYSVGMERSLELSNVSIKTTYNWISEDYNVVFSSGYSYIATKSK